MGKTNTFFDRLEPKSLSGLLRAHFQEHYKLPPKAADTICQDLVVARLLFTPHSRDEGQILYYAIKLGQPVSRSVRDCEKLPVKLTLMGPEDMAIRQRDGLQSLTQQVMARIAAETLAQGAVLSVEDVALILHLSERTVKRYKKAAAAVGHPVRLRGDMTDMGPASTHRAPVIELFMQGYPETVIADRLHHQLSNVEHYIRDFLRVSLLIEDGYAVGEAGRLTGLSKGKVLAIHGLYTRLGQDDYYQPLLERTLALFRFDRRVVEKGGTT